MLVEPKAEGILDHAGDKGRTFARRQPLLGLTGKLRIAQLDREDIADIGPDIVRCQLYTARQQIAKLTELTHRLGQTSTKPVDMGASLRGRNQIDITFRYSLTTLGQPQHSPIGCLQSACHGADKRLLGQSFDPLQGIHQVVWQTILIAPFIVLRLPFLVKTDLQPRAQDRFGTQHMAQLPDTEFGAVKITGVRPETHPGAGIQLANLADHFQIRHLPAIGKGNIVLLAVTLDPNLQVL